MSNSRTVRIVCLVLPLMALTAFVQAAVPQLINYQGRMTDAGGNPVDTVVSVLFTIYDYEGGVVWQEGHDGVTVTDGLFHVLLGSNEQFPEGAFVEDTTRWLGVTIGDEPEGEPFVRMVTVPWAFHAQRADVAEALVGGSNGSGWIDDGDIVRLFSYKDTVMVGNFNGGAVVNISAPASELTLHTTGLGVWAQNEGDSGTTGGFFSATAQNSKVTGIEATSTASSSDTVAATKFTATNTGAGPVYGCFSKAHQNGSEAYGYGGYFNCGGGDNAYLYGVNALAEANSRGNLIGIRAHGKNHGSGWSYGGIFEAGYQGSGGRIGVGILSQGESPDYIYGLTSNTVNNGSGYAYGQYHQTYGSFDNRVWGSYLKTVGYSDSVLLGLESVASGVTPANWVCGTSSRATNRSSGVACGGYFYASDSGSGVHYGVYAALNHLDPGAAIYAAGDFSASGIKSAILRTSRGNNKMYAMEASEVWFEDFGRGQLDGGQVHIELDPLFLEMVTIDDAHPMQVFIQLNDDCNGTYVKTSTTGFDVFELQKGTSDASFSYRVVAKRRGYEDKRMEATMVGHDDPLLYPEKGDEIYQRVRGGEDRSGPPWPSRNE